MQKPITLNFRYDIHLACRKVMEREFDHHNIAFKFLGAGEVEFLDEMNESLLIDLKLTLEKYGIYLLDHPKESLILQIKEAIQEMIEEENPEDLTKTSTYLAKKLNMSYSYISNTFSEMTLSTIENYIILQKIEKAKGMIIEGNYTLTEIAHRLNYSSVAHLSNQFKKTTGLTPSAFQRIVLKKYALKKNK
jgi:AraC-like DNA-binding protein